MESEIDLFFSSGASVWGDFAFQRNFCYVEKGWCFFF